MVVTEWDNTTKIHEKYYVNIQLSCVLILSLSTAVLYIREISEHGCY